MKYEMFNDGTVIPEAEDSDLVGYSISFCLKDIADGFVDINNVALIKAGTCIAEDWHSLIDHYIEVGCWNKKDRYKYESIIGELLSEDKIFQSRLYGIIHAGINHIWDYVYKLNSDYGVSSIDTRADFKRGNDDDEMD